jgi:hypothetical protein
LESLQVKASLQNTWKTHISTSKPDVLTQLGGLPFEPGTGKTGENLPEK